METVEYSMSSNGSVERHTGVGLRRRLSAITSFPNPFAKSGGSNAAAREALPETFMKGRKEIEELQKCMLELQRLPARSSTYWAKLRGIRDTAAACVIRVSTTEGFLCEEVLQYRDVTSCSNQLSITAERRLSDDFIKVTQVLKAYMTEINSVMESFPAVYLWSKRYNHYKMKCERMQRNNDTKKLPSNQSKREEVRAKFQAAVSGSNAMINATLLKKDAFLQAIFYHFVLLDNDLSKPSAASIQYMAHIAGARMMGLNTLNIKNPHPKPIDTMPEKKKDKENSGEDGKKDQKKKEKDGSEKYDSEKEDNSKKELSPQSIIAHHNNNSNNNKKQKKRTKSGATLS